MPLTDRQREYFKDMLIQATRLEQIFDLLTSTQVDGLYTKLKIWYKGLRLAELQAQKQAIDETIAEIGG